MVKSRDLETLAANMRKKQTWADIEETLKNDPRIMLPDRRALTMWNSFELARFRGVDEDFEEFEDRKRDVNQRQAEVVQTARNGDSNMVDLGHVASALDAQTKRIDMWAQHHQDFAETDRQQRASMYHEQQGAMNDISRAAHTAAQKAEMAAHVTQLHIDRSVADRDMITAAIAAAGVPHTNVHNVHNYYNTDASVHNTDATTHNHTHNTDASVRNIDATTHHHTNHVDQSVTNTSNTQYDQTVHTQMMAFMQTHQAQIGEAMQRFNLTAEEAVKKLHLHIKNTQEDHDGDVVMNSGGRPPPPQPPGNGAVVSSGHRGIQLHMAPQALSPSIAAMFNNQGPPPSGGGSSKRKNSVPIQVITDQPHHPVFSNPPQPSGNAFHLHMVPKPPPHPTPVFATSSSSSGGPPPGPGGGAAIVAAAPLVVAEAPAQIQEPAKSRARSTTPRPVTRKSRAKSQEVPTRAHTPKPAPKSKSEEDMSDPPSANDPGKSSATKRAVSFNDQKVEEAKEAPKEKKSRGRSATPQQIVVVESPPKPKSRPPSSRKASKDPTAGADPTGEPEHFVIGGRSPSASSVARSASASKAASRKSSRAASQDPSSDPVAPASSRKSSRAPSRPRSRAASAAAAAAASDPIIGPHMVSIAAAAHALGQDVNPQPVANLAANDEDNAPLSRILESVRGRGRPKGSKNKTPAASKSRSRSNAITPNIIDDDSAPIFRPRARKNSRSSSRQILISPDDPLKKMDDEFSPPRQPSRSSSKRIPRAK